MKFKDMTPKEVLRHQAIMRRIKKFRIKKKLAKRISNGTFNGFLKWIEMKGKHEAFPKLPSSVELAKINFEGSKP